jgi:uncharacterized membrane protein YbhN (UPF0104 family)
MSPGESQSERRRRTRRVILASAFAAVSALSLYLLLPQLAGLSRTWRRIDQGDPVWLAVALLFETLSFAGYMVLFRTVCARGETAVGWRDSCRITLAGLAATRLFAAAGIGGIVLTGWALRALGLGSATVVRRLTALLVCLYSVYAATVVLVGAGLSAGLLPGPAPAGLTTVPAVAAAAALALAVLLARVPHAVEPRLRRLAQRSGRRGRLSGQAAQLPSLLADGARDAVSLLRARRPGLLGAVAWWAFDIATLWACLRAFGGEPEIAPVVMAYFTGMLANLLPLPGGVGGVEGGMIAALIAFGVDDGLAIAAVLSYRAFSFWLPTIPGAIAYLQLRRRLGAPDQSPAAGNH